MKKNGPLPSSAPKCPVRLPAHPLLAKFRAGADGSLALSILHGGKAILIETRPGFSRILRHDEHGWHEKTLSPAASGAAHVCTAVDIGPHRVMKRVQTRFIGGTLRNDWFTFEKDRLSRRAHWTFPSKFTAAATYSPAGRKLEYSDPAGRLIAGFDTSYRPASAGYRSDTQRTMSGDVGPVIVGSPTVHPGSSTTVIGHTIVGLPGKQTSGPMSYNTITKALDGTTTVTTVIPEADSRGFTGSAVSWGVTNPDGSFSSFTQITGMDRNGQSFVGTNSTSVGSDGSVTNTNGVAGTTQDGGFYSVTETHSRDGSGQRSSFAADSQGNSSETTVTYNPDGGFTISTTSKGSDGSTSTNETTYTKDGNPVTPAGGDSGPGSGEGSGSGSGSGEGSGSGSGEGSGSGSGEGSGSGSGEGSGSGSGEGSGSGSGEGSGTGSYPTDDGHDEAPHHNFGHSAGDLFGSWLDDTFGAQAGSHRAPVPRGDPGDPASLLSSACGDDIEGNSRGSAGGGGSDTFDLRPYLRAEPDPENNPRALIEALGVLAGNQSIQHLQQLQNIGMDM